MSTLFQPGGSRIPVPAVPDANPFVRQPRLAAYDSGGGVLFTTPPVPLLAAPEVPDDPRLGRRAASYAAYPYVARAESLEQLAPALGAVSQHPDTTRRAALFTPAVPFLARAESVEQWAPTLQWSSVGPDRTWRVTLPIAEYPSLARGEAIEQLAVPPLAWLGTWPDTTRRLSLQTGQYPTHVTGTSPEQWSIPALSWQPRYLDAIVRREQRWLWQIYVRWPDGTEEPFIPPFAEGAWFPVYPDRTSRAALTTARLLAAAVRGEAPEQFVAPPLSWLGQYPDRTLRLALTVAQHVGIRSEAVEQFAAPALSWLGTWPDSTRRAALKTAQLVDGFTFALQDLVTSVPALSWGPTYPDTTRRTSLPVADLPVTFRAESVERFAPTLLWSVTAPDATRRLALPVSLMPTTFRAESVEQFAIALGAAVYAPSTTRRVTLAPAAIPTEAVRAPSLEQWPPVLQWAFSGPEMTRRMALQTVQQLASATGTSPERWSVPALSWLGHQPDIARGRWRLNVGPSLALIQIITYSASPNLGRTIRVLPRRDLMTVFDAGRGLFVPLRPRTLTIVSSRTLSDPTPYPSAILADSPLSYWRLNEPSGVTAVDQRGVANGTYAVGVGLSQAGALADGDRAIAVDGTLAAAVDFGKPAALNLTGSMTLEGWVRRASVAQIIFSDLSGPHTQMRVLLDATGVLAWTQTHTDASFLTFGATTPLPLNTYAHIAIVRDDIAKTVTVYLNGVVDGAASYAGKTVEADTLCGTKRLGVNLDAALDEFAIYKQALSADRVAAHYAAARVLPGLSRIILVPPRPSKDEV